MSGFDPTRLIGQAAQSLASDGRSLEALKRAAARDPQAAVRQAAQQFEALFMQMVLKSMREAGPKSGLFDSAAQDMTQGMLDQQMAQKMAGSGTGLAEVIARQLTRHLPAATESTRALPAPSSTAPAIDRYAELERRPSGPSRYDALARTDRTEAVRAAYLERRTTPAAANDRVAAADALPAATSDLRADQRNFVTRHWDHALSAQRATGIPARFVLSQAALESGWGRSEIRGADGLPSHNLFGIKATGGWQGRTVDVVTTEYDKGVPKQVVERFRAYNNYGEAFRDWAQLLAGNPRYAGVLHQGRDAAGFAFGLQRAGYATDPAYGEKLVRVIGSLDALRAPG
jgi:flagellar protein FlgJ